jgi:uncharacterized membrane-anchored protein
MSGSRHTFALVAALLAGSAVAAADEPAKPAKPAAEAEAAADPFAKIKFDKSPLKGKLEDVATVDLPEGYLFIQGRAEVEKFIEATKNLPNQQEMGVVLPANGEEWWLEFDFDPMGYVKDDDKGELDADKMLDAMKQGTERANEERRRRGWGELHVVGWHTPPRYNPTTHNLEWATRLRSSNGNEDVNYNVRLLGRRGVTSATLIISPAQLDATLPKLQGLLTKFSYNPDQTYASYRPGDKIAKYGLVALVTGGTIAIAAKTGLLGKMWKFLLLGFAAIGGWLKKVFGKKKVQPGVDSPPV